MLSNHYLRTYQIVLTVNSGTLDFTTFKKDLEKPFAPLGKKTHEYKVSGESDMYEVYFVIPYNPSAIMILLIFQIICLD